MVEQYNCIQHFSIPVCRLGATIEVGRLYYSNWCYDQAHEDHSIAQMEYVLGHKMLKFVLSIYLQIQQMRLDPCRLVCQVFSSYQNKYDYYEYDSSKNSRQSHFLSNNKLDATISAVCAASTFVGCSFHPTLICPINNPGSAGTLMRHMYVIPAFL